MALQSHNQSNEANCSADMEVCTYELDCSIGPSGLVLNSKLSPYRSRSSIFFRPLCVMSWRLSATSFPEPTRVSMTILYVRSRILILGPIGELINVGIHTWMHTFRGNCSRSSIFFQRLCVMSWRLGATSFPEPTRVSMTILYVRSRILILGPIGELINVGIYPRLS